MAKRIFTEEERDQYRQQMLDAGFDLLKQYGMTHMSIAKITESAGIGVSTFYNFFSSKEEYVYEVLQHRRKKIPELISMVLNGKEKIGPAEARAYLKMVIDERYSVFPSLTPEDEQRLYDMLPEQARPNLERETEIGNWFFQMIEGVRPDVNLPVVANLVKIYVLAAEGKDILHREAYEAAMERMRDLILYEIFGRTQ